MRGLTMEMEAFEQTIKGRSSRQVWLVAGGVLAVVALAGGYYLYSRPKTPTAAMLAKDDELLLLMERDDSRSLQAAADGFAKLVDDAKTAQIPAFYAPKANQLIALSLLSYDIRRQVQELLDRATVIEREIKHLQDKQESADWRARVGLQTDKLSQLKAVTDPLQAKQATLDADESKLFKELNDARTHAEGPVAEIDRGLGMYSGLRGADTAAKLAERYRKAHADGWADLIGAAVAAQPRRTQEEYRAGLAAAQTTLKANPQLIRAKRLEAVIDIETKDYSAARSLIQELNLASTDDPDAKRMAAQVDALEAAAKAPAVPAANPGSPGAPAAAPPSGAAPPHP